MTSTLKIFAMGKSKTKLLNELKKDKDTHFMNIRKEKKINKNYSIILLSLNAMYCVRRNTLPQLTGFCMDFLALLVLSIKCFFLIFFVSLNVVFIEIWNPRCRHLLLIIFLFFVFFDSFVANV